MIRDPGEYEVIPPHDGGGKWMHHVTLTKRDWPLDLEPMVTIHVDRNDGDERGWHTDAHVTLHAGAWPSRRGARDNVDSQLWQLEAGHIKTHGQDKVQLMTPHGRQIRVRLIVHRRCWFAIESKHL